LNLIKPLSLLIVIFLLNIIHIFSQELPNSLRQKEIIVQTDSIVLDSLSLVPGSIVLTDQNGEIIPASDYYLNNIASVIVFTKTSGFYTGKKLKIKYRVFPINFAKSYQLKDTSLILRDFQKDKSPESYKISSKDFFDEDDRLTKNGSISRGFSVGNQQDLSTLSNFNLQLAGKLNDEVSILAAVSDNNVPIQPEGNTQQLQEFDKVSIKLFTEKSGIELGDINLEKPQGYFLNLNKQNRGIRLYSDFKDKADKKYTLKSDLTAGMAKGKYNRQKFTGIEGNQGPYKLIGENSETYIIILSGSEKVYIDGKLLTRGEKFDYVIDYNSAELVFTANQPITKDSRIVVEYEYAQQFYPRLQFLQTNNLKVRNSNFWMNFYLENDNKKDPLSENYTDDTKLFLSGLGDSINKAYAPNIHKVVFSNDRVLYVLKDSLVNGLIYDSVFVYSSNPDSAIYQLGFAYVGQNQGNYKPLVNNANGKVYQWVSPIEGVPQGAYEPINLFITPKKSLMANAGGNFRINSKGTASVEFALSNSDVNTYSSFDKKNDPGYAMKFNITQNLMNQDTSKQNLKMYSNYRMSSENFKPIENYHEVEYERVWNLPSITDSWKEQYFDAGVSYIKKGLGIINAKVGMMSRANNYKGKVADFSTRLGFKNFLLESYASLVTTDDGFYNTNYLKHKVTISKSTKYFVAGLSEETENNVWTIDSTNNLASNSFKFIEYSAFLKQADSSVNQYFMNYKYRRDFSPQNGSMLEWSTAQTAQAGLQLLKNKDFTTKTILTYRNLITVDSTSQTKNAEDYISGRQEINLRVGKGAISLSGFYETGSGLEIRRQYQFLQVQKGLGQYTWIDYNNNNIKELDEFEPAKFQDEAEYIQIFIPTNEYVRVYNTQASGGLSLMPERVWMKSTGFKGFLAVFSDQLAGNIVQKANHPDYFPDLTDNEDLISRLFMFRNNFSFKSKNRKYQLDYLIEANNSKILLINGLDTRSIKNHSLKLRYKIYKIVTLYNTALTGWQSFESEFFSWKNYNIKQESNETRLEILISKSILSNISYRYASKSNTGGEENSVSKEIKLAATLEMSAKVNLQADFRYISTEFNGETNSAVAYEMLEGLKKGQNLLWNLSYNQKLSKVLFLTLSYNGRLSDDVPAIHNGSLQMRANF